METEEIMDTEHPEEILISDQINSLEGTTEDKTFFSKHKSFIKICCAILIGVGTFLLGIAAVLTVIRPNRVEVKITSEDFRKLTQPEKHEESLEIEKSLRKVDQDPKASVINKAIAEAHSVLPSVF